MNEETQLELIYYSKTQDLTEIPEFDNVECGEKVKVFGIHTMW